MGLPKDEGVVALSFGGLPKDEEVVGLSFGNPPKDGRAGRSGGICDFFGGVG